MSKAEKTPAEQMKAGLRPGRLGGLLVLAILALLIGIAAFFAGQSCEELAERYAEKIDEWSGHSNAGPLEKVVGKVGAVVVQFAVIFSVALLEIRKLIHPLMWARSLPELGNKMCASVKKFVSGKESWSNCLDALSKPGELLALIGLLLGSTPGVADPPLPPPKPEVVHVYERVLLPYTDRVHFDEADIDGDEGVTLTAQGKRELQQTMNSLSELAECYQKQDGQEDEGNPIMVTVHGFSSDRGFRRSVDPEGDKPRNVTAANRRAASVHAYLRNWPRKQQEASEVIGSFDLMEIAEPVPWTDFDEMKTARDSELGEKAQPVDQRIVWLEMSSSGPCEVPRKDEKPNKEKQAVARHLKGLAGTN